MEYIVITMIGPCNNRVLGGNFWSVRAPYLRFSQVGDYTVPRIKRVVCH